MYCGRIFMTSYNFSIIATVYAAQVLPRVTQLASKSQSQDSNLSPDAASGPVSPTSSHLAKCPSLPPFLKTMVLED